MTKRRRLIFALALLLLGGYFLYDYVYKDHRNISAEVSKIEIVAPYLLERFKKDDAASLLNATLTVDGEITQTEEGTITLDSSVQCSMINGTKGLVKGDKIVIKGRCIGYDDLLEIVKLDQCTIIK